MPKVLQFPPVLHEEAPQREGGVALLGEAPGEEGEAIVGRVSDTPQFLKVLGKLVFALTVSLR